MFFFFDMKIRTRIRSPRERGKLPKLVHLILLSVINNHWQLVKIKGSKMKPQFLVRRTRVKKKIELDLLQNSFNDYRCSNNTLRTLLKAVVTREISAYILLDCNFQLPNNVVATVAEMLAAKECQHYITCGEMGSY